MQPHFAQLDPLAPRPPVSRRRGARQLLGLSAAIIPAMLSQMLLGFFDTWMCSKIGVTELSVAGFHLPLDTVRDASAGELALSAVVPAGIAFFAVVVFFRGVTFTCGTFASQALGRGEPAEGARYCWQGLYLSLMTVAVSLLAFMSAGPCFERVGPRAEVLAAELSYFNVIIWSIPLVAAGSAFRGFFNGIHRPLITAGVGIAMNLVNLVLNWMMIYGRLGLPRMGLGGAALASLIASALAASAMFACFLAPPIARAYRTRERPGLSLRRLTRLIRLGAPVGASWFVDLVGWSIMLIVILQRVGAELGPAHPAAGNAAISYLQIGFMPVVGVGMAGLALVGKAVGRRDFRSARRYADTAFLLGGGYQLLVGLLMILFRHELIRFFSDDPEVIRLGGHALIWAGLFQFFDAMGIVYANALRGAGDTRFVMILTWVLIGGLFIPGSFAATWGLMPRIDRDLMSIGPWIAGTVYLVILGLACRLRWRGRRWQQIDIFGGAVGRHGDRPVAE